MQLVVNAEKGSAAGIVQAYADCDTLTAYAAELDRTLPTDGRGRASAALRSTSATQRWYNPTLNYQHYMVPALLVALVTIIGTLLTAQNIAREKELGTLEQLNVTPMTRASSSRRSCCRSGCCRADRSRARPRDRRSSCSACRCGGVCCCSTGPRRSTWSSRWASGSGSRRCETQQQAMFVTFFIMIIYLLMSGLFTPIDSMPDWVQRVAERTRCGTS